MYEYALHHARKHFCRYSLQLTCHIKGCFKTNGKGRVKLPKERRIQRWLEITKKHNEDFENSSKCLFCHKNYVDVGVKVKDHCQVTGKYRSSVYRDCNINVKSNNKILVNKNFDFHVIMQELGNFSLKINVILNGLEKYMSFNISKKLVFIF